jgi:nitronate monooxygenase
MTRTPQAGSAWPARFTARTLRNRFTDIWHDHEDGLRVDADAKAEFRQGVSRGDLDYVPIWAGEAVDLINEWGAADAVLRRIVDEALFAAVRANCGPNVELIELESDINDPAFAEAMVAKLHGFLGGAA